MDKADTFSILGDCCSQGLLENRPHLKAMGFMNWIALANSIYNDATNADNLEMSNYEIRNLKLDLSGEAFDWFLEKKADWLVLDPNDCRMKIVKTSNGGVYTLSNAGIQFHNMESNGDVYDIESNSIEDYCKAIDVVCEKLLTVYQPNEIIINKHFRVEEFYDYDKNMMRKFVFGENQFIGLNQKGTDKLKLIYQYLEKKLEGCHVIEFPENVFGDSKHRFGPHPLHYHPFYLEYNRKALSIILSKSDNEKALLRDLKNEYSLRFKYERKKLEANNFERVKYKLRAKNIIIVDGKRGIAKNIAEKLLNDTDVERVCICSDTASLTSSYYVERKNVVITKKKFDICDINSHYDFFVELENEWGFVPDGLILANNVGFDGSNWKGFNIAENEWERVMNNNLKGPFFMIRNFSNYLFEKRVKGSICVVSSISAHRDLLSIQQITETSLSGIVSCYGKYLAERGIILNAVEPGTIDLDEADYLRDYTNGLRDGVQWHDNSIRRVIRLEEIAECISFLMSVNNEVLSGSCLVAGGGCKSLSRIF